MNFGSRILKMVGVKPTPLPAPVSKRFIVMPPTLMSGEARRGAFVLVNRYEYAGVGRALAENPWRQSFDERDSSWREAMFGFTWLDDLATHGGELAVKKARQLVLDFIDFINKYPLGEANGEVMRIDVVAERLGRLLRRSLFLFTYDPPPDLRQRLLGFLSQEAHNIITESIDELNPIEQLRAKIGACLAAFCLEGFSQYLPALLDQIKILLQKIVLSDGLIASRSPWQQIRLLIELIGLRDAFIHGKIDPPSFLTDSIASMAPAARMLRHGDGCLPLFHASREGNPALIDTALTKSFSQQRSPDVLEKGGFARMKSDDFCVFMDIGGPPASEFIESYHASPLAIEVSHGNQRLFVNCGAMRLNHAEWRRVGRSSAAHSTIILKETSVVDPTNPDRALHLNYERQEEGGAQWLKASHNGYQSRFGVAVSRKLYLPPGGRELSGEDILSGSLQPVRFVIRFHLHPSLEVIEVDDHIQMVAADGNRWLFRSHNCRQSIQDSIYLGGIRPAMSSRQIVLEGETDVDDTVVNWYLEQGR